MRKTVRGPYKSRIPPPKNTPGTNELISKDTAISFITSKIIENQSEWRTARGKVADRVNNAIKNNKLLFINGQIVFGDLMAWARGKKDWVEKLAEFPRTISRKITDNLTISDDKSEAVLPGTLERSHDALIEIQKLLDQTTRQLRERNEEMQQMRPKVERYDKICAKNRESGGKRQT